MKSKILLILAQHNAAKSNVRVRISRDNGSEKDYLMRTRQRAQRMDDALTEHAVLDNFLIADQRLSVWFEPKE